VTIAYTSGGIRLWTRRYDRSHGTDAASDIAVSPDGSTVFVTGSTATIAYRSDGTILWTAPATPGSHLAVSPDGSKVYVASGDILTVGIDAATGGELWEASYPAGGEDGGAIAGIVASPNGKRVYVAGAGVEMGGPWTWLIAYDEDGNQVWASLFMPEGTGWASSLALSADGTRIYMAGGDMDYVPFVAAYSAAGLELFEAYPWFKGMSYEAPLTAIAAAPAGRRVFVTGSTHLYTPGDFATFAIGSTGTQSWGVPYDGPGHRGDSAASIVVSPDGSTVFVTGSSTGIGTGTDFATVAYRAG
jgi:DNA-binding beta-propeller fold protein YncE